MPSPFPGMDPYLEHPAVFPDVHDSLITYLREAINAVLPPPYYARGSARVWIEPARRHVEPDVDVLRPLQPGNGTAGGAGHAAAAGGVAVAAEPVIVRVEQEEVREPFLEIHAGPDEDRLIATVEVLSLANKTTGVQGRVLYQRKQAEVLKGRVHLVEIDLLRGGTHATAVPREEALAQAGPFDYHVCVRQWDRPSGEFCVYPIRLEQRLPRITVPLLPGDPAVTVELQALLDRYYDSGQCARWVRYRERTPAPPLRPEQAEWARRILREKGLLPPSPAAD